MCIRDRYPLDQCLRDDVDAALLDRQCPNVALHEGGLERLLAKRQLLDHVERSGEGRPGEFVAADVGDVLVEEPAADLCGDGGDESCADDGVIGLVDHRAGCVGPGIAGIFGFGEGGRAWQQGRPAARGGVRLSPQARLNQVSAVADPLCFHAVGYEAVGDSGYGLDHGIALQQRSHEIPRRYEVLRVFDPKNFIPSWDFVTTLLEGNAVVKTIPGIAHSLVPDGVEAEWISDGGNLVEACLWGQPYASARRRATLLPGAATLTEAEDPGDARTNAPGAVIYEPDDAVIRAGLVTAVAAQVGGCLLYTSPS